VISSRGRGVVFSIATLNILVILDRITKYIFGINPALRGKFFLGGLVQTVEHRNYGIIANIPIPFAGIMIATLAAIVLIGLGLLRAWREKSMKRAFPLILILGGAIGNLWDRIQYGYVYDWLLFFGRSAINVADIAIFIGIILYVFIQRNTNRSTEIEKSH
jgi:signal peptidase II